MRISVLCTSLAISLVLTACGGGGGGSGGSTTPVAPLPSSAAATSSSSSSSSSSPSPSSSSSSSSVATTSSSSSSSATSVYSANVSHLRDLATFPIGVAVSNTDSPSLNILTNASEQKVAETHFSIMTAGNIMKVSYLHPSLNSFTFTDADAFIDYAKSKNIQVHGHTLVWHSSYQVPSFMQNWSGTSDDFLTMLDTHVNTIISHFKTKGNVPSWDVVNEAIDDNNPAGFRTDSTFYIKSGNSAVYIERAFKAARLADPDVDLYYNDYNTEQNGAKTTKLIAMITDFQARSIPITGVGFQMHVCLNYPSAATIAAALKQVVDKGLKVKISELDVAINQPYCDNYPANKVTSFTQTVALAQKKRYCDIIAAYMNTVPLSQRGGITVWGSNDGITWLDGLYATQFNNQKISWPLLLDANYNDKPALRGFADGLLGTACTNL